jgi:hypothetical protein
LVGFGDPRGVDLERGGAAAGVAEAAGDGADVDAGGDELGGGVVAQLVQGGVDTQPGGEVVVPLGHRGRLQRRSTIGRCGEEVCVGRQLQAEGGGALLAAGAVLGQDGHGLGVEGDVATLVGLGVLFPGVRAVLGDAVLQRQDCACLVDVGPAQAAQLTAAGAGGHGQPDQRTEVGVLPGIGHDARGLVGRGRPRVGWGSGRWLGLRGRIDGDPFPAHGALVGAADDEVDLADGPGRQRRADMPPAAAVASVGPVGAVIDRTAPAAMVAAAAQLGIERVQDVRVDRADLLMPDQRPDVLVDIAAVGRQRGAFGFDHLQVAVEQLVQRRAGPWVPLLPDLGEHPSQRRVGQVTRLRASRNDLGEVAAALGDRVTADVDAHLQRPAGQLPDAAALALATPDRRCHVRHGRALRGTACGTRPVWIYETGCCAWSERAPPAGFEPALPPPEGGALSPELRGRAAMGDGGRVAHTGR